MFARISAITVAISAGVSTRTRPTISSRTYVGSDAHTSGAYACATCPTMLLKFITC